MATRKALTDLTEGILLLQQQVACVNEQLADALGRLEALTAVVDQQEEVALRFREGLWEDDVIKLNVGGQVFHTSSETLLSREPQSFFTLLLSGRFPL